MTETIEIRPAINDEATYRAILALLVDHMHPEVSEVPIDSDKTLNGVYDCLATGVAFCAWDGDKLVGSLGAMAFDGWWFSSEVCLFDRWYYVLPEYRKGHVAKHLERAYRGAAEARKMRAYLADSNANRSKMRGRRGRVASLSGFTPMGAIMQVSGGG